MNKYDHVRLNMWEPDWSKVGEHHCHWPGCHNKVPPAMWGCRKHWKALPPPIQQEIWDAYRAGQEETKTPSRDYITAAQNAQAWIAENHPPTPRHLSTCGLCYSKPRPAPVEQPAFL